MIDEHDKRTLELLPGQAVAVAAPQGQTGTPDQHVEGKPKRLPRQSIYRPPFKAKSADGLPVSVLTSQFVVPVSSVAREWGISSRRVRKMLEEGRLMGRQLENGYWEVFYPYQYILGTRGPALTRQRNLPESEYSKRKKAREQFEEWNF